MFKKEKNYKYKKLIITIIKLYNKPYKDNINIIKNYININYFNFIFNFNFNFNFNYIFNFTFNFTLIKPLLLFKVLIIAFLILTLKNFF
jgi:hypothetical protein